MLCGRCCVTEPRSRPALRLDIFIEILPRPSRIRQEEATVFEVKWLRHEEASKEYDV
jgi:hypothetical protein